MVLMARSIEMSFSASRPRRALRSMSIGSLLSCAQVRTGIRPSAQPALAQPVLVGLQRSELDLDPSRAELGIAEPPALTLDIEPDPVGVSAGDPSRDSLRVRGGRGVLRPERGRDQAADGAPPVLRLGQRAVDARRGYLQRVGRLAHGGRAVER